MSNIFGTILYIYNPDYPKSMSRKLFEQLAEGHYILYYEGKLIVTNKFIRTFETPPAGPEPVPVEPKIEEKSKFVMPVSPSISSLIAPMPIAASSVLMKFISDSKIPDKIKTRDSFYWANRYNAKAEKEFLKILKDGYQYDILVVATKLYYQSGGQPKAIANYILDGIWMGCYNDVVTGVQNGTVDELIKKGTDKGDADGFTKYER